MADVEPLLQESLQQHVESCPDDYVILDEKQPYREHSANESQGLGGTLQNLAKHLKRPDSKVCI